jgi:hypothetical protein
MPCCQGECHLWRTVKLLVPRGMGTPVYRLKLYTKVEQTTSVQHTITRYAEETPCVPLGSDLLSVGPGPAMACG